MGETHHPCNPARAKPPSLGPPAFPQQLARKAAVPTPCSIKQCSSFICGPNPCCGFAVACLSQIAILGYSQMSLFLLVKSPAVLFFRSTLPAAREVRSAVDTQPTPSPGLASLQVAAAAERADLPASCGPSGLTGRRVSGMTHSACSAFGALQALFRVCFKSCFWEYLFGLWSHSFLEPNCS